MAKAVIACDGCGKEAPMKCVNGNWYKPRDWYQRTDDDGTQVACSRECVDKVAAATNKTSVILPV